MRAYTSHPIFIGTRAPRIDYRYIIFGGVAAFFALSFALFLFSFPSHDATAQTPAAVASARAAAPYGDTQEMHIANNGLMLLRGAKVTAINGKIITVTIGWGTQQFSWQVLTDASSYETHTYGTRFFSSDGKQLSPSDVWVGDRVTVTGMLVGSTNSFTIDADTVRKL